MNPPEVQVERRAGQRFSFLLPVFIREISSGAEARGFTQDISSRGVFFFTDAAFHEGSAIELTLNMPSEITLGDSMRVRCRGSVLRVVVPPVFSEPDPSPLRSEEIPRSVSVGNVGANARAETKIGVAVRLHDYEYLPDTVDSSSVHRVAGLHEHRSEPERAESGRLDGREHQPALVSRDWTGH